MQASVREQVRDFIRDSFFAEGYDDQDSFLGKGIIDSLGVLQLVSFIEGTYAFKVKDDDLVPENFDSVSRLVTFIERRTEAR